MSLEGHKSDFSGIKNIFRQSAVLKKNKQFQTKSTPPFSLRLTQEKR